MEGLKHCIEAHKQSTLDLAMNNSTNSTAVVLDYCGDQETSLKNIFYASFLVFIMIATIIGNALVIAAVCMFPRLRRMTNFFIVSLAVSDLLVGLMHLPLRIDSTVRNMWCQPMGVCAYWVVIDAIFSAASICNLAVISVDRYLAITRPFDYQELMSKCRATAVIAFVWIYASLWGLLGLFDWETGRYPISIDKPPGLCKNKNPVYYTTTACFSFFLPLLITIVMYMFVFRVALKQAKAMAKMDPGKKSRRHMVREMKATKTLAIVIGVFTVSWLPFFTMLVLAFWCPICVKPLLDIRALGQAIHIIFVSFLPPINSCVNPIIYSVFNSEFRSAFQRMLSLKRFRQSHYSTVEHELSVTEMNHNRTNRCA